METRISVSTIMVLYLYFIRINGIRRYANGGKGADRLEQEGDMFSPYKPI
jgi:hypothetical protein